jgi:hypothetical protein
VIHQPELFEEIGVPMASSLDPMPFDQMPDPERILEVLAKHEMSLLEALPDA